MAEEKKPAAGEGTKRKVPKGRHLSAMKRHRQNVKRNVANVGILSSVRTLMKKVRQAVEKKDATLAKTLLSSTMSQLHKAAKKGIIHDRHAARHIGRLSSLVSKV